MKPQLIYGQLDSEYRKSEPELSQTILKNISNKSASHALWSMNNHTDTPAMKLGRAAHCMILEGEKAFNDRYAVSPECDRRTKEGKAIYAAFQESVNG